MARFFRVDPGTLELSPEISDWPPSLSTNSSRMVEECLESVVATNLDTLFPGINLLLIGLEDSLCIQADIQAIDPLGFVHIFELKKTKVNPSQVKDQVLSYALFEARHDADYWKTALSAHLSVWPETLGIAIASFRRNVRIKNKGRETVGIDNKNEWLKRDRFQRAQMLVEAILLKVDDPHLTTKKFNSDVDYAFRRTCAGVDIASVDHISYMEAGELVRRRWGFSPRRNNLMLTLAAPTFPDQSFADSLAARGVFVNLIEADLRGNGSDFVLRWSPVKQTLPLHLHAFLVKAKSLLSHHRSSEFVVGRSILRGECAIRISWPTCDNIFITIYDDHIKTGCDGLTDGLRDLAKSRLVGMKRLFSEFSGNSDISMDGRNICARWSNTSMQSATDLIAKYYDMCIEIGLSDLELANSRPAYLNTRQRQRAAT